MANILVIEDEDTVRRAVMASLKAAKHNVFEASDAKRAFQILDNEYIDLALSDLRLPGKSGIDFLREVKSQKYPCDVIIMTGYATVDTAVQAMQEGASDYITKPFNPGELTIRIERVLKQKQLQKKILQLERELNEKFHSDNIISSSNSMGLVLKQVKSIAPTDSSVLITGESGTGKELIANTIHHYSLRRDKPFVAVNCGALPETLLESELFGHIKGAFTGAIETRQGLIETSDGGTLLLDEIGDASLSVQVKLLRVLENGTMRRVGDTQERKVNVRLLAATNKDLKKEIDSGRFRQDLYFRINVIPIHLPSLKERPEDIPLLAKYFLKQHVSRLKKNIKGIDSSVLKLFLEYNWPGNIRELENAIEYSVTISETNKIKLKDLPINFQQKDQTKSKQETISSSEILSLPELEKRHILLTLDIVNWHQRKACDLLKISKVTLYRRLKEYGITPPKPE